MPKSWQQKKKKKLAAKSKVSSQVFLRTSKVRTTFYRMVNSYAGSTALQLSFKWSHFRILSIDWKVRTTLYSAISTTKGTFIWMVTLQDFIHRLKILNHLVQYYKQHHRKVPVLLSSFHFEWSHFRISSTDSKVWTTLCEEGFYTVKGRLRC